MRQRNRSSSAQSDATGFLFSGFPPKRPRFRRVAFRRQSRPRSQLRSFSPTWANVAIRLETPRPRFVALALVAPTLRRRRVPSPRSGFPPAAHVGPASRRRSLLPSGRPGNEKSPRSRQTPRGDFGLPEDIHDLFQERRLPRGLPDDHDLRLQMVMIVANSRHRSGLRRMNFGADYSSVSTGIMVNLTAVATPNEKSPKTFTDIWIFLDMGTQIE